MLLSTMSKSNLAAIAFLAVIITTAFVMGLKTTKSLEWPGDSDNYRDIASAQTIADGELTSDNNYLNEKLWYNPLIPGLIASLNEITGVPIPKLYAQAGTYLNLLAPISFAVMVWILFGKRVAVLATIAFLFLINDHFRSLSLASYTPWLFPVTFMQSFFYLLIALFVYILKNQKGNRFYFLLGSFTGITFLGHVAPALLFAFIVTFILALEFRKTRSSEILKRIGIFVFSSILLALPLIYFVAFVYQFKTLNYAPNTWLGSFNISNLIAENVNIALLIAAIGLVTLPQNKISKRILGLWIIGAAVFLIYSLVVTYLTRKQIAYLPALVPWFHFYFYLKAAEIVLFGYGLLKLCELLFVEPVVILSAVTVMLFPAFMNRPDFMEDRKSALLNAQRFREIAAYHWIREHTQPRDVFLGSDYHSLFVINPAGRKTVCTKKEFSNPFVNFEKRDADRNQMFDYLLENHHTEFQELAENYSLDYVISTDQTLVLSLLQNRNFSKSFESLGLYIFERKTSDINGMLLGNSDMIL